MIPTPAVKISNLQFGYGDDRRIFDGLSLEVPRGSRTLLLGANGVGKSTLLRLIAGQHLLPKECLEVFGQSPFYAVSGEIPGIALIDSHFPLYVDLRVQELLDHSEISADPKRRKDLIEILGISPAWRMAKVSEGQRRRVQMLLALQRPTHLLLMDEVTAHLDVVVRADLLNWLRESPLNQGLTVIYTTHILDGLWTDDKGAWPTHLSFLSFGDPIFMSPLDQIPGLSQRSPLLTLCESWIRRDLLKDSRRRQF